MEKAQSVHPIIDEVIHAALADGSAVCIRTIRATDEERMRKGIEQLSAHSRYLRFFSSQRSLPDGVIEKLIQVDGHQHIAWGAILSNDAEDPAIGAVHVFRDSEHSANGEFSVAILDEYHGMGLARMLTAVLLINCRLEKISSLLVQTLSENRAALNLVRSLGGERSRTASGISDFTLDTELALHRLRGQSEQKGLQDVLRQLERYLQPFVP